MNRLTPLVFLLLAVAWTWPAAAAGQSWLVGRFFDLPGTVWFIDAAPRMGLHLHDPLTGWPGGLTYQRPDSFTLLGLSALLSALPAGFVHASLQVIGVWLSAWAAEAFARSLGAEAPWSWIAGLAFGFSGLAATALLEGHAYHVLDPWMPLFALCWLRATSAGGRWFHGLLAGIFFCLTALTTAYLGIAAAVLALGFAAGGLLSLRRRFPFGPALIAAGIVGAFAAWYLHTFGGAPPGLPGYDANSRVLFLIGNSTTLAELATPLPSVDRFQHAASATFSATALALALLSPVVLGLRDRRVLIVLFTGFAALILSMGPWLVLGERWIPLPMSALARFSAVDLLRHPRRLAWAWMLCGGALGAVSATVIARKIGNKALILLALALIDAFVVVDMPRRQRSRIAAAPSAYAGEGAVLDLFPTQPGMTYELNAWTQALACQYQVSHQRPILDDCVATRVDENPRVAPGQQVINALLTGDLRAVRQRLRDGQISAVALHGDLFHPADRRRLAAALARLDSAPAESTDGGEHLLVYRFKL